MKKRKRMKKSHTTIPKLPQTIKVLEDEERSGLFRSLLLSSVGLIKMHLIHLRPEDLRPLMADLKEIVERLETTIESDPKL